MNIAIRADQIRVGDHVVSIEYTYDSKVTRLEVLPSGHIEITMRNRVRTVAPATQVTVRR
jgi:hypothetical protein